MNKKSKITLYLSVIAAAVLTGAALVFCILCLISYRAYHPASVVSGEHTYELESSRIPQNGLKGVKDIMSKSQDLPQICDIAYFEAVLDKDGNILSFTLSLDIYDNNIVYSGTARYTYSDKKLTYDPPKKENTTLVYRYNKNNSLDFLDAEIKKLPLKEQIAVSGLQNYVIRYQPDTVVPSGTPIFDGRNGGAFPVLGKEDYNAGKGGVSDGKTDVVFRLYDGTSIVEGQQYLYVCKPADAEAAEGNHLSTMECDYRIDSGSLTFTRDYGADWINTDLTKEDLNSTLEFYRSSLTLPPQSMFVSSDQSLPIAFFYGGNPVLSVSSDNGNSWSHIPFPTASDFGRSITKRAVGFVSSEFGYAALGTDWSMGGGETKRCYFTSDGGQTWKAKPLPLEGTSSTLTDMAMADEKTGIVTLEAGMDASFPVLYATENTGDSWTEITLPWNQLPAEVQYLSDIKSFTVINGVYTLTLGQEDSGTVRASFTATDPAGAWQYAGFNEGTVHTVG